MKATSSLLSSIMKKKVDPKLTQLTYDIYQLRLPLPYALNHVNLYLLRGAAGWTVIDTGLNTAESRAGWQMAMEMLALNATTVQQIILTHVHPDHYGLAGWLQQQWVNPKTGESPPIFASAREIEIAQETWHKQEDWLQSLTPFWVTCGVPQPIAQKVSEATASTRNLMNPLPSHVQPIDESQPIRLGDRQMKVIHSPGHSDGQLIFFDERDGLLLVGDHVLQKITPNISRWPGSEPNPLGRYLNSLNSLLDLPVQQAFPGHRAILTDWRGRITELLHHHDERIEMSAKAVAEPVTVYEASRLIFNHDNFSMHEVRFAVTETLAHLEHLQAEGRIRRSGEDLWQFEKLS